MMGRAQHNALQGAYTSLKDGQYDDALYRLSLADRFTPPSAELHAEIVFLRGRCHESLNRLAEAAGCYKFVTATYPHTSFAQQASSRLEILNKKTTNP